MCIWTPHSVWEGAEWTTNGERVGRECSRCPSLKDALPLWRFSNAIFRLPPIRCQRPRLFHLRTQPFKILLTWHEKLPIQARIQRKTKLHISPSYSHIAPGSIYYGRIEDGTGERCQAVRLGANANLLFTQFTSARNAWKPARFCKVTQTSHVYTPETTLACDYSRIMTTRKKKKTRTQGLLSGLSYYHPLCLLIPLLFLFGVAARQLMSTFVSA